MFGLLYAFTASLFVVGGWAASLFAVYTAIRKNTVTAWILFVVGLILPQIALWWFFVNPAWQFFFVVVNIVVLIIVIFNTVKFGCECGGSSKKGHNHHGKSESECCACWSCDSCSSCKKKSHPKKHYD